MVSFLNMRSVQPELTGHEVIRRVAMELFAQHGADRVTIRGIAAAAGVSPALVLHHYGSKDGLREAVNARALELMEHLITDVAGGLGTHSSTSIVELCRSGLEAEPHLLDYLRRLLLDGGDAADTLFRSLFELTRTTMAALDGAGLARPAIDSPTRDAFLLVNDLALILLRDRLTAVLGSDPLAGAGLATWSEQVLDVYAHGILRAPDEEARS